MEQPIQAQPIPNRRKDDHEIDLIEIITVLWRARKFIAIVTGIALTIGILYIIFATPLYRGTISLYPAVDTGMNSPMTAMARQLGVSSGATGVSAFNIPDVAKSRTLSEKILLQEWHIEGYEKKMTLLDFFKKINDNEIPVDITDRDDQDKWNASRLIYYSKYLSSERISVNEDKSTGLLMVNIDLENPALARDVANYISSFISSWVNDTQKESIRKNLAFINERAAVLGSELQDAENELKKFRETNRNILNSPDLQLELQRLQRQVAIKQEVYLTMVKQREINQIEENKYLDVIRILDNAVINNKPVKPKKSTTLLNSFALGLLLSLFTLALKFIYTKYFKSKFN